MVVAAAVAGLPLNGGVLVGEPVEPLLDALLGLVAALDARANHRIGHACGEDHRFGGEPGLRLLGIVVKVGQGVVLGPLIEKGHQAVGVVGVAGGYKGAGEHRHAVLEVEQGFGCQLPLLGAGIIAGDPQARGDRFLGQQLLATGPVGQLIELLQQDRVVGVGQCLHAGLDIEVGGVGPVHPVVAEVQLGPLFQGHGVSGRYQGGAQRQTEHQPTCERCRQPCRRPSHHSLRQTLERTCRALVEAVAPAGFECRHRWAQASGG